MWHACKDVLAQSDKFATARALHVAAGLPCRNYVHLTLWAFKYPLASPRAHPPMQAALRPQQELVWGQAVLAPSCDSKVMDLVAWVL